MRFMVLVKANKNSEAGVLPDEKILTEMGKFNEELVKAGVMLAGEGLHPSSKGARVKFSGRKRTVIDGPFTETKELIAGFWLWQVKSKEEAIEWLKRAPFDRGPRSRSARSSRRRTSPPSDPRAGRGSSARPGGAARASGSRRRQARLRVRGLHRRTEDALIGSRDGFRHASRHRRGLEDRVGQAHRRPRADGARRRPRRGARAGRARRRARAVAGVGRPGQPGRLAHGHREAPRDRPAAPQQAARAQARGARPRARGGAGDGRAGSRRRDRRRRRRRPARASCSSPAIRSSPPRRAWRSRSACSEA